VQWWIWCGAEAAALAAVDAGRSRDGGGDGDWYYHGLPAVSAVACSNNGRAVARFFYFLKTSLPCVDDGARQTQLCVLALVTGDCFFLPGVQFDARQSIFAVRDVRGRTLMRLLPCNILPCALCRAPR
jgi:hypothetical protein